MLKLPLIQLGEDNSGIINGDTVCLFIDLAMSEFSYVRHFKKKLTQILAKYTGLFLKYIVNLHSTHHENREILKGNKLRVRRKMTREKPMLVKVLTFLAKYSDTYKLAFYPQFNETPLDIVVTWFFDF